MALSFADNRSERHSHPEFFRNWSVPPCVWSRSIFDFPNSSGRACLSCFAVYCFVLKTPPRHVTQVVSRGKKKRKIQKKKKFYFFSNRRKPRTAPLIRPPTCPTREWPFSCPCNKTVEIFDSSRPAPAEVLLQNTTGFVQKCKKRKTRRRCRPFTSVFR